MESWTWGRHEGLLNPFGGFANLFATNDPLDENTCLHFSSSAPNALRRYPADRGGKMAKTNELRSVARIVNSVQTLEGEGFLVHRPFPSRILSDFDPFLLLDEMGPMDLGPGEAKGAPDHPHRGFETVTYMLSGRMEHGDSRGNRGRLGPGDVQWMTAGSGVVHSEMPEADFAARGGRMHGFQLWVNLPRRDKMMAPRYQEVPAAKIPVGRS